MKRQLVLAAATLPLLAGCFGTRDPDAHCDDPAEYQESQAASSVQVPADLNAPARATTYVVPQPTGADVQGIACLARPPPYFKAPPAPVPGSTMPPTERPEPPGKPGPPSD